MGNLTHGAFIPPAAKRLSETMKCPNCGREVMLARVCPYCNEKIRIKSPRKGEVTPFKKVHHREEKERGEFKGRISEKRAPEERMRLTPLQLIIEYMKDPAVPLSKKLMIIGAAAYVLSPVDLLPAFLFPLSIVDDALVVGYLLRTLSAELIKYRLGYY